MLNNSGAGLGGLTAAAVIGQQATDVLIDVYEAKAEVSVLGAPIAIWKRSWQVLQGMGLEDEVRTRGIPLPREGEGRGPVFRKSDKPEGGFEFHSHILPYGPTALPRAILTQILQAKLQQKTTTIHTSKRLVNYQRDLVTGLITLNFADGSTATTDILIGADGVHSAVRASMFKELINSPTTTASDSNDYKKYIDPIWSGMYAYRCTVPADKLKEHYPDHPALGPPKIVSSASHFVSHQVHGNLINLVCYSTAAEEGAIYGEAWVTDVGKEEVLKHYTNWEPSARQLLELLEKPSRWAIHIVPALPFEISTSVALIGDAAHAMAPHQGVGGGQAIEVSWWISSFDAYVLGRLLAHSQTTRENVQQALIAYQTIRQPISQAALENSRINGLLYEFKHPDYPVGQQATYADMKQLSTAIVKSFEWLAGGNCDDDLERAIGLLVNVAA
ncbi:hypothetical protein GALMADRAFT_1328829 [Galerina marginata CBS 339.88]|uniref:FAD-binding domain-containing protein n=1 Tax=Galerina marginata (strain CBS 339.88) TaxID=685588 RepID=A0A067T0Y6_GALM3|nr:hypothetical protein GALMADRAFT_1328829 [Galerina marginata CBS 339.88]